MSGKKPLFEEGGGSQNLAYQHQLPPMAPDLPPPGAPSKRMAPPPPSQLPPPYHPGAPGPHYHPGQHPYHPHMVPTHQVVRKEVSRTYEKTSCFKSTVPRLPKCLALTYCIFNCIIPGWGTIGAAFSACCYEQYEKEERKPCCPKCNFCCGTFMFGILQFMTTPVFLLGFVWSIMWGLELLKVSDSVTTTVVTTITSAEEQPRMPDQHASAFPTAHLEEKQLPPGRV